MLSKHPLTVSRDAQALECVKKLSGEFVKWFGMSHERQQRLYPHIQPRFRRDLL